MTEVDFKIPPDEVVHFSKPTYKIKIMARSTKFSRGPKMYLVDTGARRTMVGDELLKPLWGREFHQFSSSCHG